MRSPPVVEQRGQPCEACLDLRFCRVDLREAELRGPARRRFKEHTHYYDGKGALLVALEHGEGQDLALL